MQRIHANARARLFDAMDVAFTRGAWTGLLDVATILSSGAVEADAEGRLNVPLPEETWDGRLLVCAEGMAPATVGPRLFSAGDVVKVDLAKAAALTGWRL